MNAEKKSRNIDMEWEKRVLCSDESCIGTIGPDGRCRECGQPYEGTLPWVPAHDQRDESAPVTVGQADADGDAQVQENPAAPVDEEPADRDQNASPDDEWERRTLCPDESCIGVIGPDGRCKECGRSV